MARRRLPCCDGHHGFALLRRLDAELFEKGAESHQPAAARCAATRTRNQPKNRKSVMAVTAAQPGSVPYLPPTSRQME